MPVETCPLCLRMYAHLNQHLVVENKEERKLLLAIESGRINARMCKCPIVGCDKFSNRLDQHVRTHSKISLVAQDDALRRCKRREIIMKLTALRASNPAVPMVSTLDLEEHHHPEKADVPPDQENLEEEECDHTGCKSQKNLLSRSGGRPEQKGRRYRILKRSSASLGATRLGQVTQKLLSSSYVDAPAEEALEATEQPSSQSDPSASQAARRVQWQGDPHQRRYALHL